MNLNGFAYRFFVLHNFDDLVVTTAVAGAAARRGRCRRGAPAALQKLKKKHLFSLRMRWQEPLHEVARISA